MENCEDPSRFLALASGVPCKQKLFLTLRTDSVESNQEGGAMYIESSPNADGYVPNSSLFGPWIDSPTQVNYLRSRVSAKSVKVLEFEVTIIESRVIGK